MSKHGSPLIPGLSTVQSTKSQLLSPRPAYDEEKGQHESRVGLPRFRTRRILVPLLLVAVLTLIISGRKDGALEHIWRIGAKKPPPKPHRPVYQMPDDPIQRWGANPPTIGPQHSLLVGGLVPWPAKQPPKPNAVGLSKLGPKADAVYNVGHRAKDLYREQLYDFVQYAVPAALRPQLKEGLDRYMGPFQPLNGIPWSETKRIWQTDKDGRSRHLEPVTTWTKSTAVREDGWQYKLLSDAETVLWVRERFAEEFGDNNVNYMWKNLPAGIMRSDVWRYLVLMLEGGIYTDTDTRMLSPPAAWGTGADLWKGGEGWLDERSRERIKNGEDIDVVIGKPSIITGVEADVGERPDWNEWWPRPLQIVQWTMGAAPSHPIVIAAVMRILHATAEAANWAADRWAHILFLRQTGEWDEADKLMQATVVSNPKHGGPMGVMDWTGPGVWTDAVLNYLAVQYGVNWTDLRELRRPLRIGDVIVLPVTGFSPGVGNFGAGEPTDGQARVSHLFHGTWKPESERKPSGPG